MTGGLSKRTRKRKLANEEDGKGNEEDGKRNEKKRRGNGKERREREKEKKQRRKRKPPLHVVGIVVLDRDVYVRSMDSKIPDWKHSCWDPNGGSQIMREQSICSATMAMPINTLITTYCHKLALIQVQLQELLTTVPDLHSHANPMPPQWAWLARAEDALALGKRAIFVAPARFPEFVSRRLQQIGYAAPDQLEQKVSLRGVVSLEAGSAFLDSVSVGWNQESHFLQRELFQGALDAFRLQVQSCFAIQDWESLPIVCKRARRSHRHNSMRPEGVEATNVSARVFHIQSWEIEGVDDSDYVAERCAALSLNKAGCPDQVLSMSSLFDRAEEPQPSLKGLPVILVPDFLLALLFAGAWHDLVLLARWTHPEIKELSVSWPEDWLEERMGKHAEPKPPVPLDALSLEKLMGVLRSAVPHILATQLDDDQAAAARLQLCSAVESIQAHAESLQPVHRDSRKLLDLPEKFIRQIIASLDLKSKVRLKEHAAKFVSCLPDATVPSAIAWVERTFASQTSISSGHVYLDMAMLLLHRLRVEASSVFTYAWGDSSQKGGLDVYNTRHRWLLADSVVELARAFRWLCLHQSPANHEQEISEDEATERCRLSQLLFNGIHLHTQVPQMIGQGRSSLLDKVGAHVHSTLLEVRSLEELSAALGNCVAWCCDMGTEAGLPQCVVEYPEDVLPSFIRPSRIQPDIVVEDGSVELCLEGLAPVNEAGRGNLMQRAILIPGTCHAIHNASSNLDSAFAHWDRFYSSLKTLHKLIGMKGRRERFVEVVLKNVPQYDQGKALFRHFSKTLYTERWGEVASYLEEGLPLLLFLRQNWDEVVYSRGMDGTAPSAEDGFLPSAITEVLRDEFFCAYWQLQLLLRSRIYKLLRWAEGCWCHEGLLMGASSHVQQVRLRAEISCPRATPCRCPMAGCRASEMVAGHLDVFADQLLKTNANEVLVDCGARLGVGEWNQLNQEFHRGASYVVENLRLRLSFYQGLPWIILGGCHADVEVARCHLRRARDLWQRLPDEAHSLQHPQARELFYPGELRSELDTFLDSPCALSRCPLLEKYLAPLTFIQISERIIEAAHKDLGAQSSKQSLTQYSVGLRVPELMQLLDRDPGAFEQLVDVFGQGRTMSNFPELFPGHSKHPDWLHLGRHPKTWQRLAAIRKILYRDPQIQHGDTTEAGVVQEQGKKAHERAHRPFARKDALCEALVFAEACTQYLRDRCSEDEGQVLSISDKLYMPLLLRPSSIHRPAHAPCAMSAPQKNDIVMSVLPNSGQPAAPIVPSVHQTSTETVSLLRSIESLGLSKFLEEFKLWETSGSVLLCLPGTEGVDAALTSRLLQHLTECSAFKSASAANRSRGAVVPGPLLSVVPALAVRGFIEENEDGWFLTRSAVEGMTFKHALCNPRTLPMLALQPVEDLSLCELMVRSFVAGWKWRKLPLKQEARAKLGYQAGGELVWYTAGVTACKEYLLCLLSADRLRAEHSLEWIPHFAAPEVFQHLLDGKTLHEALDLVPHRHGRKRKAQAALTLDGDVDQGLPALSESVLGGADMPPLANEPHQEMDDALADEILAHFESDLEEVMAEQQAAEHVSDGGDVAGAAPALPPIPEEDRAELVAAASSIEPPMSAPRARLRHEDRPPPWGSFTFNRKLPASAPPHGGMEAVCRFHALNARSGCKKFVRFETPDDHGEAACMIKLKHWCNQARRFDRQRTHVRMPLRPSDIPPPDIVEKQILLDDPPDRVRNDLELDGDQGASSSAAKPKPKSKSKSKAKASKAKARPKKAAKQGAESGESEEQASEAEPPSPSSPSSSSSTSSSSSS